MGKYDEFQFRAKGESPDYLMWQVFNQWQKGKNELIAQLDITAPQMTLLAAIYWLKQNGEETIQTTIASAANMDKMTTSTVLRTLQKKDFILRAEHSTDTRAKTVELTKKGLKVAVIALQLVDQHNLKFFSALGSSKADFIKHLKKLQNQ